MKSKLLTSLSIDVDQETKDVLHGLNDDEADKLCEAIQESYNLSKERVSPILVIKELRKHSNVVSYKVNLSIDISSNISIQE